jgi:hypothetical protein
MALCLSVSVTQGFCIQKDTKLPEAELNARMGTTRTKEEGKKCE